MLCCLLAIFLAGAGVFSFYYIRYSRMIDQRLGGAIYENTSHVFAAPQRIFTGEQLRPSALTDDLLHAGYTDQDNPGAPGRFRVTGSTIEIHPSATSYFGEANALRVEFTGNTITRIMALPRGDALGEAEVEPQLLTNLFGSSREKRRVMRYQDLPPILVQAVLAAEDKRFFEHPGFDPLRVAGAAWADLRRGQKAQGASTLDMQVARSFLFTNERTWQRKMAETLVALELEQRFSKQQIFELYANEVYLGNRGSFAIRGFGEAATAYFGKDVRELSLGESAFLAAIIRSPNRYATAERHPDRAIEARDRVLAQMVEDSMIKPEQADAAKREKLRFTGGGVESAAAPYFVDMVRDNLLENFSETDLTTQSYRIYTSLDPDLQRAASEAIDIGIRNVDAQLVRRYAAWKRKGEAVPPVQVALVALDPKTGEIRALVGGRSYGESQLNHALARRQPGSSFKPFVYAAAFENAVEGLQPIITPVTTVVDEPTTFSFDGKDYTPNNYGEEFDGTVTVRTALTRSLNVATVKVAEMVGYDRVASYAKQLGLDPHIEGTPAVALGAYEMTPLEVASGYTIFANQGVRAEPLFVKRVVEADGSAAEQDAPRTRAVMDPRVAYLVTSLMEDVLNRGTGAGVRGRGFTAPAAGKTGTSRDGWFAGFTSNLLCVVWVGFDDNRDLDLSGATSAGPVWAEFMKRAVALPAYKNVQDFTAPAGIVQVTIDPQSGELATPECPQTQSEVFIQGTEPTEYCPLHGGRASAEHAPAGWLGKLFGQPNSATPGQPGANAASGAGGGSANPAGGGGQPSGGTHPAAADNGKKKGVLTRIFGIFGGSKKPAAAPPKP